MLVVAVLGLLLVIGPSGSACRTNGAFAVCWEDADGAELAGGEFLERVIECKTPYCPVQWEPSQIEMAGLFVQTSLNGKDRPSCVELPELSLAGSASSTCHSLLCAVVAMLRKSNFRYMNVGLFTHDE